MLIATVTPLGVLKLARQLLTPDTNWTQQAYARTRDGRAIFATSYAATCFCSLGAIETASHPNDVLKEGAIQALYRAIAEPTRTALMRELHETDDSRVIAPSVIASWNDDPKRTHAEVLAAFDEAIRALETQEATA